MLRKNFSSAPGKCFPQNSSWPLWEQKSSLPLELQFLRNLFPSAAKGGGHYVLLVWITSSIPEGTLGTCRLSLHCVVSEKKIGKCPEHDQRWTVPDCTRNSIRFLKGIVLLKDPDIFLSHRQFCIDLILF